MPASPRPNAATLALHTALQHRGLPFKDLEHVLKHALAQPELNQAIALPEEPAEHACPALMRLFKNHARTAEEFDRAKAWKMLRQAGAEAVQTERETMWHVWATSAVGNDRAQDCVSKDLKAMGLSMDVRNYLGQTPMEAAVQVQNWRAAERLAKWGGAYDRIQVLHQLMHHRLEFSRPTYAEGWSDDVYPAWLVLFQRVIEPATATELETVDPVEGVSATERLAQTIERAHADALVQWWVDKGVNWDHPLASPQEGLATPRAVVMAWAEQLAAPPFETFQTLVAEWQRQALETALPQAEALLVPRRPRL